MQTAICAIGTSGGSSFTLLAWLSVGVPYSIVPTQSSTTKTSSTASTANTSTLASASAPAEMVLSAVDADRLS